MEGDSGVVYSWVALGKGEVAMARVEHPARGVLFRRAREPMPIGTRVECNPPEQIALQEGDVLLTFDNIESLETLEGLLERVGKSLGR